MLLPFDFFEKFQQLLRTSNVNLERALGEITQPKSYPSLDFYNQISAVYSAKIEGNSLDLNSFVNAEGVSKKREKTEIDDLLLAYRFAEKTELSERNFLLSHGMLSTSFLIAEKQGAYRDEPIGVMSENGLVYVAIEPDKVAAEMNTLFSEIAELLERNLSAEETVYFAALTHLRLAHIHPFADGNGRAARLLEKWFLAAKLGQTSWWIQSERYYFENRNAYYNAINLGSNYYELDYKHSTDFARMLVEAVAG